MDSLVLRYKFKLLLQFDKNEKGDLAVPKQLVSFLNQRNIYKTDKILENLYLLIDKFSYIFNNQKSILDGYKWPLVIYFYRRKFTSKILVLSPFNSSIIPKFADERNSYYHKKFVPWDFKDEYEEKVILSPIVIFKINLLKFFFFSDEISLYAFKMNLFSLPGVVHSLRERPFLKKRKINFRRKFRYDSEGRIVNK